MAAARKLVNIIRLLKSYKNVGELKGLAKNANVEVFEYFILNVSNKARRAVFLLINTWHWYFVLNNSFQ